LKLVRWYLTFVGVFMIKIDVLIVWKSHITISKEHYSHFCRYHLKLNKTTYTCVYILQKRRYLKLKELEILMIIWLYEQLILYTHTYLLTYETGYWSIFIYVYMTGCVKCNVYFSTFVFANESYFFLCRVLSFIFYWFGMVRRKLAIPERWQAVGMYSSGLSHRRVADHFRISHSIIVRLIQRFRQTGNVTDRPRAGRPRKATPKNDFHQTIGPVSMCE
jgi:hypothetical protein